MAIKKDITKIVKVKVEIGGNTISETRKEVILKDSYIKIDSVISDKNKVALRLNCKSGDSVFSEVVEIGSDEIIKVAYELLKTNEDFKHCEDC